MRRPSSTRSSRLRAGLLLAALVTLTAGAALGVELGPPVSHEFVPPDPREDVMLGTTTPVGDLPSALETPSGTVTAPDPFRLPTANEKAYGRTSAPETNLFFPDRDTRKVTQVDYDDPFSPSLTPFKRLSAFDAVNPDYTFRVVEPPARRVLVGGSVQAGEDTFYGDLTVDLVAGEPVRIPTVGPGTRVLRLHTVPQVAVEVLRDSADNYFLRGAIRSRVRVLMELSAPRASLGGPLREALWSELLPAPPLPKSAQAAAEEVNRAIGVSRVMPFREAVTQLVGYYRGFSTTDEPLPSRPGGDIFLDLAMAKKGVCRHRAFAFVVSALALRIPARLVTNEAHAWVEVNDGALWHRIDLGGAAQNFQDNTAEERLAHSAPPDPFGWPPGASPGQESADRTRRARPPDGAPAGSASAGAGTGLPTGASSAPGQGAPGPGGVPSTGRGTAPDDTEDARPAARIRVTTGEHEIFRNQPLHLEGKVDSAGGACAYLRLDVLLVGEGQELPLGSLATDGDGQFQGAVIVPATVTMGDYDVVVATPGDARCGRARSGDTP